MSESTPGVERNTLSSWLQNVLQDPALRYALILFVTVRLFLTVWAVIILTIRPVPVEPDEVLRPYLGQPQFSGGVTGALLGPWQRFDTQHYMRIAEEGYAAEEDSVYPPLYPLASAAIGWTLSPLFPAAERNMIGALILSNIAYIGVLILLYRIADDELDAAVARRTVLYFAIFPTSFFLLAAYSESLFLFFALAAIRSERAGKFLMAGLMGLLASLTRLTGLVLVLPLLYEYMKQRQFNWKQVRWDGIAIVLPVLGSAGFLLWRSLAGLPPMGMVFEEYWYRTTGIPGTDLVRAVVWIFRQEVSFTMLFNLLCAVVLIITTIQAFRLLGPTYGLYSAGLLLFMLLPTSGMKPLYSFSRYTLPLFPAFMVIAHYATTAWRNRAVVYPSIALLLYFSGQFLMWGWVA